MSTQVVAPVAVGVLVVISVSVVGGCCLQRRRKPRDPYRASEGRPSEQTPEDVEAQRAQHRNDVAYNGRPGSVRQQASATQPSSQQYGSAQPGAGPGSGANGRYQTGTELPSRSSGKGSAGLASAADVAQAPAGAAPSAIPAERQESYLQAPAASRAPSSRDRANGRDAKLAEGRVSAAPSTVPGSGTGADLPVRFTLCTAVHERSANASHCEAAALSTSMELHTFATAASVHSCAAAVDE